MIDLSLLVLSFVCFADSLQFPFPPNPPGGEQFSTVTLVLWNGENRTSSWISGGLSRLKTLNIGNILQG